MEKGMLFKFYQAGLISDDMFHKFRVDISKSLLVDRLI